MRARGSMRRGYAICAGQQLGNPGGGARFRELFRKSLAILDQKNAGKEKRGSLDVCASTEFD